MNEQVRIEAVLDKYKNNDRIHVMKSLLEESRIMCANLHIEHDDLDSQADQDKCLTDLKRILRRISRINTI